MVGAITADRCWQSDQRGKFNTVRVKLYELLILMLLLITASYIDLSRTSGLLRW